jgi:hypothetical protein
VARPQMDWLNYPIAGELSRDVQWEIASTTQAILKKEGGGPNSSRMVLAIEDVPGFEPRDSDSNHEEWSTTVPTIQRSPTFPVRLSAKEIKMIDLKRKSVHALRAMTSAIAARSKL